MEEHFVGDLNNTPYSKEKNIDNRFDKKLKKELKDLSDKVGKNAEQKINIDNHFLLVIKKIKKKFPKLEIEDVRYILAKNPNFDFESLERVKEVFPKLEIEDVKYILDKDPNFDFKELKKIKETFPGLKIEDVKKILEEGNFYFLELLEDYFKKQEYLREKKERKESVDNDWRD